MRRMDRDTGGQESHGRAAALGWDEKNYVGKGERYERWC